LAKRLCADTYVLPRTHFGLAISTFFDRLAVGCLRKQPTGIEENRRLAVLEKVLEEVPNQPSIALSCFLSRSPHAALATLVLTRESILFRVPPFSQCFRGG
jgi:hypothetical protein